MSRLAVVDYARYHGLTSDHRANFSQKLALIIGESSAHTQHHKDDSTWKDDVARIWTSPTAIPGSCTEEKIQLTYTQLHLLQDVICPCSIDLTFDPTGLWDKLLPDHRYIRNLRVDEPILHIGGGDIQQDVETVKKTVRINRILQDFYHQWQVYHKDLGIRDTKSSDFWSDAFYSATKKRLSVIWNEKISITEAALAKIAQILHDDITEATIDCISNVESRPITRLASEVLSYSPDAHSEERRTLQSPLSKRKTSLTPEPSETASDYLSTNTTNPSLPRKWSEEISGFHTDYLFGAHDLGLYKIEGHETQTGTGDSDAAIDQTSNDRIKEELATDPRPSETRESGMSSDQKRVSPFIRNEIQTIFTTTLASTKLSNLRAKIEPRSVPQIDRGVFERSRKLLQEGAIKVESLTEHEDCKRDDDNISCVTLQGNYPRGVCDEKIVHKNITLHELTPKLGNQIEGDELLLWKQSGPKILDNDVADDDNLSISLLTDEHELSEHSWSVGEEAITSACQPHNQAPKSQIADPSHAQTCSGSTAPSLTRQACDAATPPAHQISVRQDPPLFSASESLSAFLDLRGKKFSRPAAISNNMALEIQDDPIESTQESRPADCIQSDECTYDLLEARLLKNSTIHWPRTIVLNNGVIQSHPDLVPSCQHQGGSLLNIIYRDFDYVDQVYPDIILNPSSCLLTSNIQSFLQKSLPGQTRRLPARTVRDKLLQLAQTFDLVIVLIARPKMSLATAAILTQVTAYCSSISNTTRGDIRPIFLHHDTLQQLKERTNLWVWACICEHAFPTAEVSERHVEAKSINLLQDETTWELFLRRAGMNVMAAQVVLTLLRNMECHTDAVPDRQDARGRGLASFVRMNAQSRLELFGGIVGSRLIELVSAVLDYSGDSGETDAAGFLC